MQCPICGHEYNLNGKCLYCGFQAATDYVLMRTLSPVSVDDVAERRFCVKHAELAKADEERRANETKKAEQEKREEARKAQEEKEKAAKPAPVRGADVEFQLYVSSEEARTGVKKAVTYNRMETCPECAGTGEKAHVTCAACKGKGQVRVKRKRVVSFPAGSKSGETFVALDGGSDGFFGGERGALKVLLNVRETVKEDVTSNGATSPSDPAVYAKLHTKAVPYKPGKDKCYMEYRESKGATALSVTYNRSKPWIGYAVGALLILSGLAAAEAIVLQGVIQITLGIMLIVLTGTGSKQSERKILEKLFADCPGYFTESEIKGMAAVPKNNKQLDAIASAMKTRNGWKHL